MAIEFKCPKCRKELFAQEQFAGKPVTCPACQTRFSIPPVPAPDEFIPEPPPSVAAEIQLPVQPKIEVAPLEIKPVESPENSTKRCPYCAEVIQAAARKCRFCNEYLDESLRHDDELKRQNSAALTREQRALRSTRMWRSLSILATSLTSGWMTWLTLGYVWDRIDPVTAASSLPPAPWTLIVFNAALMFGLFRLVRAMRVGPASIFTSAAFAIVCCMPLNVALGMPIPSIEQARLTNPIFKDYTQENLYDAVMLSTGFIGFLFSLPVWFTALKLAAQARLERLRKP